MHDATNDPIPAELLAIAERLGFPTLETRSSDDLDFRDVAVWMVRDALRHAYEAGRRAAAAGPPTRCICPACRREIEITPLT
jgi:hypothetical protein